MAARHPRPRVPQTFWLENFGGGIDLRAGEFSLDQNRFADLVNCRVDKGRKLKRRWPVVRVAGTFSANTFGMIDVNGVLYTLAQRGSAITVPTGVNVLSFDLPPSHAISTTVLIDIDKINGFPQAILQHDNGKQVLTLLHVFDKAPDQLTYVTDPRFPWTHQTTPFGRIPLAAVVSKSWAATPTHDVASSATALPRIWNNLLQTDVVSQGYEYHFFTPTNGIQAFTVPQKYEDVIDLARFHSYVIERFIGTDGNYQSSKNWVQVTEEIGTVNPAIGHAALAATLNLSPQASYANWTSLLINAAPSTWYRIRIFPPNTAPRPVFTYVQSGCVVQTQYNAGAMPTASFVGNGVQTIFMLDPGIYWHATGRTYTVTVGGVAKATPADYVVTVGTSGQPVVTFTAAPAIGAAMKIDPVSPSDYVNSMPVNATVHVPAGTIMTSQGVKTWLGGIVTIPGALDGHACMIGIALDANQNPTGLVAVPAGSSGSSTANTSGIPGATRLSTCWVGSAWMSSGGVVAYTWSQAYDLTSRDPTWDQTEFLRAGLYAGGTDAVTLPTGQQESSAGPVTMIMGVKNRLLVAYRSACELWSVDTVSSGDGLIDVSAMGTGLQTAPYAVTFDNAVVSPSINGIRSLKLERQLSDDLVDLEIGDQIADYGSPNQQAACFWQHQGEYVAAVTMADGSNQFLVYDYSPQSKIAAWNRWTVAGLGAVDYKTLIAIDGRLYFRSGGYLHYFDTAATVFRDFGDVPGNAYVSLGMWHYNHMKRPGVQKRLKRLDVIQTNGHNDATKGTAVFSFRSLVWSDGYEELGPTITGCTVGLPQTPLSMTTSSIAPIFRTQDETGWCLEALGLEFIFLDRSIL